MEEKSPKASTFGTQIMWCARKGENYMYVVEEEGE